MECPFNHQGYVLLIYSLELVRYVHLFVKLSYFRDKPLSLFPVIFQALGYARNICQLSKWLVHTLSKVLQYIWQYDCVGQTVWHPIEASQCMCNSMYIANVGSCKGQSGIIGCLLHILPGLNIISILIGFKYILENQLYGFSAPLPCFLGVASSYVGFNSVGQGI